MTDLNLYPSRSPSIGRQPTCQDCKSIILLSNCAGCAEGLWTLRGSPGVPMDQFLDAIERAPTCPQFIKTPDEAEP